MRILGLDLGQKTIGVAISDPLGFTAQGITTIHRKSKAADIEELKKICKEYGVEKIVIGLPKNMDSSKGSRAVKCEEFAKALSDYTGIESVMRDERLTTVSAHNALNATNTRGKKRKSVVDQVAAVVILQDFIDYRKNQIQT